MEIHKLINELKDIWNISRQLKRVGQYFLPLIPDGTHGNITIYSVKLGPNEQAENFVLFVQNALTLIQETDPPAFSMVECEISAVVNAYIPATGTYNPSGEVCTLDFEKFKNIRPDDPHYEWYVASAAKTIVHEAMHGYLFKQGIPYNKQTREKVEWLCEMRAARFVQRLTNPRYNFNDLVPNFDPTRWEDFWNPYKCPKHAMHILTRLVADLRSLKTAEDSGKPQEKTA